ncbi:hypothetical protein FI667_g1106, partial [Globisporangium splendens]
MNRVTRFHIVEDLQDAIFRKQKYGKRFRFARSDLTLYLAKNASGQWLQDDLSVKNLLRARIDRQYNRMRPLWKLDDYFGKKFVPAWKDIHILVELPQEAITFPAESRVGVEETKHRERLAVTESAGLATGETRLVENQATAAGADTGSWALSWVAAYLPDNLSSSESSLESTKNV